MNGSKVKLVVDTNVIFMALYNLDSKAGKIIKFANENKVQLFSPESVKEELFRVLRREIEFSEDEAHFIMESLPIIWIEKGFYESILDKTKVKHKADKPVEALALVLNCGILSADKHFTNRANINKLLSELEKNDA